MAVTCYRYVSTAQNFVGMCLLIEKIRFHLLVMLEIADLFLRLQASRNIWRFVILMSCTFNSSVAEFVLLLFTEVWNQCATYERHIKMLCSVIHCMYRTLFWPVPDYTHQLYWKTKPACCRQPYKYVYLNSELGAPGNWKWSSICMFPR